ncbi:GH25 family lysozyme [Streptomyces sp. DH7]|uniref:GH25 family lysozyme n=1 Tax=Streptomyces sp. DH7 TaxID=2857006 RepID=UPI001E44BF87|nr:GH25 family lysozyme [Streptomyces sp. DH7]
MDVSNYQVGFDYARAATEGLDFVVAKAGGCQLSEGPYTSDSYAGHIDGARAAGLRVGHYFLTGDLLSPRDAADHFVDNLHDYRGGDVLALDVEVARRLHPSVERRGCVHLVQPGPGTGRRVRALVLHQYQCAAVRRLEPDHRLWRPSLGAASAASSTQTPGTDELVHGWR